MVFDGVQLVCGRVTALSWKLFLWVVGPRAARDVDVAAAEMPTSLEGRRGRRDAVYNDAWRKKVCVLRHGGKKRAPSDFCDYPTFFVTS